VGTGTFLSPAAVHDNLEATLVNPFATIQMLILLWPLVLAGQTGGTKISCASESLPSEIQHRLAEDYGAWRIQKEEYLSARARGRWESERPLTCPGIAVGRFENTETRSYAVLLVHAQQTDAGYKFLVFSQKSGEAIYEPRLVDKLDDGGAANYFLHAVPISKFFDEASRKRFQAHTPDGILLIDSAESEYEVDVYFWSAGHYRHEPIDY